MGNRKFIVVILLVSMGILFCFVFQDKKFIILTPSPELKVAFEESSQHTAIADVADLSCFPTQRYDCNLRGGCKVATPATYYFVDRDTENGKYYRCDIEGCDTYPVRVVESGDFTQFIPVLGQAMLFKVANNDSLATLRGEFVDITTIGTTAIVSTGRCEM